MPYTQIYPSANALTNLRTNLSTQLGSKADFNVSIGYIQRAYRKKMGEVKGKDEAAQQRIEAAHSQIMMAALTSRLKVSSALATHRAS